MQARNVGIMSRLIRGLQLKGSGAGSEVSHTMQPVVIAEDLTKTEPQQLETAFPAWGGAFVGAVAANRSYVFIHNELGSGSIVVVDRVIVGSNVGFGFGGDIVTAGTSFDEVTANNWRDLRVSGFPGVLIGGNNAAVGPLLTIPTSFNAVSPANTMHHIEEKFILRPNDRLVFETRAINTELWGTFYYRVFPDAGK